MKSKLIQFALASLSFLPNLITAQIASEHRIYFTPIVYDDFIYILGGNYTSPHVPILNITNGVDVKNPDWRFTQGSSAAAAGITGYLRGVAYKNSKNDVFVHAGNTTSTMLRDLIKYIPSADAWTSATQISPQNNRPVESFMMTATWNPKDDAAYYYGGQPLDYSAALSSFAKYDTKTFQWTALKPQYPNALRPGRAGHTANIVNNQLFIMGGETKSLLNLTASTQQADFSSVLVYDISTNTAATVATLGDIPSLRQAYSTALGLDGKSIIVYGGISFDDTNTFTFPSNDIYVLDTCTLTWSKKSVGGTAPGQLFGHNAVNINNYMVLMMGMSSMTEYNERLYILDMENWKWVDSFTSKTNTISAGTCQFTMPSVNSTNFYPLGYDASVLDNPLRPKSSEAKSKGLGIGFGIFAVILIVAGIYLYRRRTRNKRARTLNPRWMRNVPTHTNNGGGAFGDDRDYPLFVYNKELDTENPNNPNVTSHTRHDVRTYTASDHEQWEQQLNEQGTQDRHDDIWNRMRGLNYTPVTQDISPNNNNHKNNNQLLDI